MFGLAQVDRLNGDVSLFMTDAYVHWLGLHMRHESQETATVRSERGK